MNRFFVLPSALVLFVLAASSLATPARSYAAPEAGGASANDVMPGVWVRVTSPWGYVALYEIEHGDNWLQCAGTGQWFLYTYQP